MASRLFLQLGNRNASAALLGIASLQLGVTLARCDREEGSHESQEPSFDRGHHLIHQNKSAGERAAAFQEPNISDISQQREKQPAPVGQDESKTTLFAKEVAVPARKDDTPVPIIAEPSRSETETVEIAEESKPQKRRRRARNTQSKETTAPAETLADTTTNAAGTQVKAPTPIVAVAPPPVNVPVVSWRELLKDAEAALAEGKVVKTTEWNGIMKAMGTQNEWKEVDSIFRRMIEGKLVPKRQPAIRGDAVSYLFGMRAAAMILPGNSHFVLSLLQLLENTKPPMAAPLHYDQAIQLLCKECRIKEAVELLEKAEQLSKSSKHKNPRQMQLTQQYRYRLVFRSMMQARDYNSALKLLKKTAAEGEPLAMEFYLLAMHTCMYGGGFQEGIRLLKEMHSMERRHEIPSAAYLQAMKHLCLFKRWKDLLSVFDCLDLRSDLAPDAATYEFALKALSDDSQWNGFMYVADKLERSQATASPSLYSGILKQMEKKGAPSVYGVKLLDIMNKDENSPPGLDQYNSVLSMLARDKKWEECASMVRFMEKSKHVLPDSTSYSLSAEAAGRCLRCDVASKMLVDMINRGHFPGRHALLHSGYACAVASKRPISKSSSGEQGDTYSSLLFASLIAFDKSAVVLLSKMKNVLIKSTGGTKP